MKKLRMVFMVMAGVLIFGGAGSRLEATASTHIWGPSTDVQPFGLWHLTSDFYFPVERDGFGNRPDALTDLGLTVGILPSKKVNMEVGFDHKTGLGDLDDYPIYFNTKIGVPEGAYGKLFPAMAFGVFDVGTEHNRTDFDVVYGKVAKTFSAGKTSLGRFSLGYFSGNSTLLLNDKGKKDNEGLLAAWERNMTDKLWVCVEYMGSKSAYGCMNYGFSWKFSDKVSVLVGYDVYNNSDLADTATVQLDVDF